MANRKAGAKSKSIVPLRQRCTHRDHWARDVNAARSPVAVATPPLIPKSLQSMLTPYRPTTDPLPELLSPVPPPDGQWGQVEPPEEGVNWSRLIAALRRHQWLILLFVIAGGAIGAASTRLLTPEYQVGATILITETRQQSGSSGGPIRASALLQSSAWVELFRSFAIVDPVVRRMKLYVIPKTPSDAALFEDLLLSPRFKPGRYVLQLDAQAKRYSLSTEESVIESGAIGDSIGRRIGVLWTLAPALLEGRQKVEFELITPREASVTLNNQLVTFLPEESSFLRLRLSGTHSQLAAATLNEWLRQYVTVAADMKRAKLSELTSILGVQLAYAESLLKRNEVSLESFRVNAITLPTEGSPLAAGVEATRDPVLQDYFAQKVAFETTRRNRESLERLVADLRAGRADLQSFFSMPAVLAEAPQLRSLLEELQLKQGELRRARQVYTDEHKTVRDLLAAVQMLQTETIPEAAATAVVTLRQREADLNGRIQSASQELKQIPSRTMQEMGLRREVAVADNLYRTLQSRYAEAQLAEASALPDIAVLDSAVAPQYPENSKAWRLVVMIVMGCVGLGICLAIVLDHLDRRFRYPEQATRELGLPIVGTIPALSKRRRSPDPVADVQVIESFRALRLQLQHLTGRTPIMLTVSSPGSGDGKSLLSANLALSFADAGYRTLLVDGDIRRGTQHSVFGASVQPGLLNYLGGHRVLEQILQKSLHDRLTIIARGTRVPGGPELLASSTMAELMAQLKSRFDAIVVDSPPLGAGIDPLALGVHTGNLLMVLRIGETDRKLAFAKLQTVHRLPIRVLGAVLNEVRAEGAYRYYAYGYGQPDAATMAGSLAPGLLEVGGAAGRV